MVRCSFASSLDILTSRTNRNDFERRMAILLNDLETTRRSWSTAPTVSSYREAKSVLDSFAEYKKTDKREWVKERKSLFALYSNIQTKIRTYALKVWEPKEGLRLEDLEDRWAGFKEAEASRSRAINAQMRQ